MSEDLAARVRARLDEIAAAAEGTGRIAWLTYLNDDGHMGYTTVAAGSETAEGVDDVWIADGKELPAPARVQVVYDQAAVLADVASKREILAYAERVFANAKEHPDDFASKGAFLAMHGVVRRLAEGLGLSDE